MKILKIYSIAIIILLLTSQYLYGYEIYPQNNGYWMNESTGKLVLETLKTRRLQLTQVQKDYDELYQQYSKVLSELNSSTKKLEETLAMEKSNYRKELLKKSLPGIGLFAGPAYNWSDNDIEIVVGFGIVWKLW